MGPRDLNVENLDEVEYNEFEISSGDTIPEMASNNQIDPSNGLSDMPT